MNITAVALVGAITIGGLGTFALSLSQASPTASSAPPLAHEAQQMSPAVNKGTELGRQDQIETQLQQRVTVSFVDADISDVVAVLSRTAGITITIDPRVVTSEAVPTVTIKVSNMPLDMALEWIMKLTGLRYEVRETEIHILSADDSGQPPDQDHEGAPELPAQAQGDGADEDALRDQLQQRVTIHFVDEELSDVVHFLRRETGINIVIDAQAVVDDEVPLITMEVQDITVENALEFLTTLSGLRYEIRNEAVFITMNRSL